MKLLDTLGITPKKEKLFVQAFTHTSYANEQNSVSYERLEYLGDAVLELLISEYLFKNTEHEEGMMTKLRAQYVCENALYEYSMQLELPKYILLGKGETDHGGRFHKAIVADVFESFMGAMFLDQGLEETKQFLYKHIIPMIESGKIGLQYDYKSILQELVQTDRRSLSYQVVSESGPAHDKIFHVEVKIDSIIYGKGCAHSKKEAEQEAAKDALQKAQHHPLKGD